MVYISCRMGGKSDFFCRGLENGSSWNQQGADIDGEAASDYSGWLVSLSADGSVVAIGAHLKIRISFRCFSSPHSRNLLIDNYAAYLPA